MEKANDATIEARVTKVYEMLIAGARRYQILQYAASEKADWNVSTRTVDYYIQEANALIAQEAEWHRGRELGRAIAALDDLYQRCMKVQDYQRALAVRRELNTLLGLHAPPAAQTIRLLGVDQAELATVLEALQQHGLKASDVFHAMLQELMENQHG
jgi:hypothetical protein